MKKLKDAVTIDASAYDYEKTKIRNKDGSLRHSLSKNDAVARALLVFTAGGGKIMKVARDNGVADKFKGREDGNQGLLRMAVGNSLRGLVRNGTHVTIGDIVVKSLEQRVAVPEVKDTDKPATVAKPKVKKAKAASKAKRPRRVSKEAQDIAAEEAA